MRARIGLIVFAWLCVAVPCPRRFCRRPEAIAGHHRATSRQRRWLRRPRPRPRRQPWRQRPRWADDLHRRVDDHSSTSTTSTSTTSTTTPTTTTTAAKGGSGTSSGTIALIVAAVVVALVIIGMVLFLLRRRRRQQWRVEGRAAAAEASSLLAVLNRGLAALDDPAAAARTWSDVESQGAHLHARLQTLAATPPDPASGAAIAGLDRSLQSLRAVVDADRALRLGAPPPTAEQLGYSSAVIRQRAADFEQSLADVDRLLTVPE